MTTVQIEQRGARGESLADFARRVGQFVGIDVPPDATDMMVANLLSEGLTDVVAAAGYKVIDPVRAKSTGNVDLANPGTAIFDTVTLINGDGLLLGNQTNPAENGVYTFNGAASALTRRADFDDAAEVVEGALVNVLEGHDMRGSWVMVTPGPITVGTTGLIWRAFNIRDITRADLAKPSGASLVSAADGMNIQAVINDATPYRAGSVVDILIVYGQSNALGTAGNTAGAPTFNTPTARVWNGAAFIPLTSYTPSANDTTSTGSAWAAFANEYCRRTGRHLVIVNGAKASQAIADLAKGGANYTNLSGWVTGAKAAIVAEGSTVGKVMVAFNQGERDSQLKTTAATYKAALAQLWTDMKADFSATQLGIFTVGYYATSDVIWGQVIQTVQRLFARDTTDAFIAYDMLGAFGSHNKLKVDSVHYTQRGYNIMGREGARRFVEAVFPDTAAPATDQQLRRFGSINAQQSQAWNLHAAILQKTTSPPAWNVNHTSPRSHSLITGVDATTSDTILNVQLACPARTILCFNAEFGGILKANNVRAAIGTTGLAATSTWPTPNADGITVLPITFYADLSLRLNMATQTLDNTIMSAALASLINQVSVVWSTGQAVITHPTTTAFATGAIMGSTGKRLRINGGATSTTVVVKDGADANVDDTVSITLRNVAIRHVDIPNTSELSVSLVAADYAVW
ncbi:sialate O-acetylesterase [Rhizorhabdus histidinilytica]|uniref:sialate O-acetylesterase n=1 Tax=Rhizorhabdus histidinilytica TaxID=439228 RepID=UPI00321FFCA2